MKLVIGCGYLGMRVAKLWRAAGHQVAATTRSAARADEFAADGIVPVIADVTRREALAALPSADTVLFAVGYDHNAAASQHEVYVEGLRNVLAEFERRQLSIDRFVYISTTGVYGEAGGEWVDETTACEPNTPGGQAHYAAEQILAASSFGPRSVILRMAGLYGPGRVPRSADLIAGKPIALPPDNYLNLIHIDDAARVVVAAASAEFVVTESPGSASVPNIYNVSDGNPLTRRKYLETMAALIGAPAPSFAPPAEALSNVRGATNRRVSNRRLARELFSAFQYPTAAEGLAKALQSISTADLKPATALTNVTSQPIAEFRAALPIASRARLLTVADLEIFPEDLPSGPVRYELHQGNLQIMPVEGYRHGAVQCQVATHLATQCQIQGQGRTFIRVAVVTSRNPDTVLVPDVCFVANDRLPLRESAEGYLETIPTLVVEVRSKNDTVAELTRKAAVYLHAGAEVVWIVDEQARNVTVFAGNQEPVTVSESAELPAPPALPGFALKAVALFDQLAR